ncbi:MAG: hypothetical protein ACE5GL_04755 [Calditrichia bacterium]
MNIQNQYTCLYHRLSSSRYKSCEFKGTAVSSIEKYADRLGEERGETNTIGDKQIPERIEHNNLVDHYISPFGLLWWGSLLVFAIAAIGLRKMIKLANSN